MRRWPQWRLSDDVTAMWQPQGGLADPFKGNAAHRRLAEARGAVAPRPLPGDGDPATPAARSRSTSAGGTHRRGHVVILAADAWTNGLLGRSIGGCR